MRRVAVDMGARLFGGGTASANIVVEGANRPQLASYVGRLGKVGGVRSATVIDQAATRAGGTATTSLVQVSWLGNSQSERSKQMVRDLRAVDPGTGAIALVGGASASAVDLIDSIGAGPVSYTHL